MPRRRQTLPPLPVKGSQAASTKEFLDSVEPSDKPQSWPIYGHLGLFVGITPKTASGGGGVKSWRFQGRIKGGPKILLTLGRYGWGNMTFEQAKKDAAWARDLCGRGVDPRLEEIWATAPSRALRPEEIRAMAAAEAPAELGMPARGTIAYIAEDFYRRHVLAENEASTAKGQRWYLDKFVLPRLGNLRPHEFTVELADEFLSDLAEHSAVNSNRTRSLLSKMWNWSRRRYPHGVANPITGSRKAPETPRNVVLTVEQIKALGRAYRASQDPNKHGCILPLIVGCRKGAVVHLPEGVIQREDRTIRFNQVPGLKGCKVVYCCEAALELLSKVVPVKERALQSSWAKLRELAGLSVRGDPKETDPTLHDLRRTFASIAVAPSHLGHKEQIVDACISHSRGRITETYMVYTDADLLSVAQSVGQYIWNLLDLEDSESPTLPTPTEAKAVGRVTLASRVKVTEERTPSALPIPARRRS